VIKHLRPSQKRLTPATADSACATRAQARFARSGAMMQRSLAGPAAAVVRHIVKYISIA